MKKILSFMLLLALGFAFIGCGEPEDVNPSKVTVSVEKTEYVVGDKFSLTVKVEPEDATNKKVTWKSSDNTVVSVDQNGSAEALKAGNVTITVAAEADATVKDEVKITVKAAEATDVKVSEIKLSADKAQLNVGEQLEVKAEVLPANATNKAYDLTTSDAAVLKVENGKVVAVAKGTAKVVATAKDGSGVKGELELTVVEGAATDVKVAEIKLSADKAELAVGEELEVAVEVLPADAANKAYDLASSDDAVLKVVDGKVVAVAEGTAKVVVTAKDGSGVTAELELTVVAAEADPTYYLVLRGYQDFVLVGGTLNLDVLFYGEAPENQEVAWSVDKEEVATVNGGVFTAVAEGKVLVTAKSVADERVYAQATINVTTDESKVDVIPTALTLKASKTQFLLHESITAAISKTFDPVDVSKFNESVYWESSDESVVAISFKYHTPYIVDCGTVTLTCFSQLNPTAYAEIEIEVVDYEEFESFIITDGVTDAEQTDYEIVIGKTKTANIVVTPANANPLATFVSSDETIATVDPDSGKITAVAEGECTVTATSVANPEFSKTINVKVVPKVQEKTEVEKVEVKGEKEMYIGYKLSLAASVYPETAPQTVTWELHETEIATMTEDGIITALAEGTIRVRAVSVALGADGKPVKSNYFIVKIKVVPQPPVIGDLHGYEIVIMNADSALSDNDPFLEKYTKADKIYKQKAWTEVQDKYNCKISVVKYPDVAPWGAQRINWIIDNATAGTSQCDLGIVSSNWIYKFAQANAAVDVSELYAKYGLSQMDNATKSAGSYAGKLYIASEGLSPTATYVDLGLYYNYGWSQKLGVKDPAEMFNNGEWTYSGFKQWVLDVQQKLGEGEFVLQGSPYYYWFGMTNAAGQKIVDTDSVKVFIDTQKSKDASALIWELCQAGAVNNSAQTWAESDDIDNSFHKGQTLMTTGALWFCKGSNRWKADLWGEGTTQFAYVPFPYPDTMKKEDTKIALTGLSVYMYIAGRPYPAELGKDGYVKVWSVMNEMFLNTIKYQEADPKFNAADQVKAALGLRIDNEASIEAIMFYNASRIFYDPAHGIYDSTSATPLKTPANNVMYRGASYDEEFNAVYETFYNDVIKIYAAS